MTVRAIDIARKLRISKATVSLALNGKPGVSNQTREAVFRCKEELEANAAIAENSELRRNGLGNTIKIIMVSHQQKIVKGSELDLWTDVLAEFDREARADGYVIGITYVEMNQSDLQPVIDECNSAQIAGVILFATEMEPEDLSFFSAIQKPIVLYDNDLSDCYNSIVIDNQSATQMAVDHLIAHHCRNIVYLAQQADIYNFRQRRIGFQNALLAHGLSIQENPIIKIGTTIGSVEANMGEYLKVHPLPDAFVTENYQVSIGVLQALRGAGYQIPQDISLVGIDALPSYMTGDRKLTTVQIPHVERVAMVMMMLKREITSPVPSKFRIMSRCTLLPGDSVQ